MASRINERPEPFSKDTPPSAVRPSLQTTVSCVASFPRAGPTSGTQHREPDAVPLPQSQRAEELASHDSVPREAHPVHLPTEHTCSRRRKNLL